MSQIYKLNAGGGGGALNTLSGDDSVIVSPNGAGNIFVFGHVVANSTHAKAVFTDSPGPNIEQIDVQVSAAIPSTDITKAGLSSFNSSQFSVDANGFVTLNPPSNVITLVDDFIACGTGNAGGQLFWQEIGGNVRTTDGTLTNPGLVQCDPGIAADNGLYLSFTNGLAVNVTSILIGSGALKLNFVISLVTLSTVANRYQTYIGLTNVPNVALPSSGVYFSYSDNVNGGKWLLNCQNAGGTTSIDSGILAITGFVNLGIIINAAGTSVSFTINGSTVGSPIITHIPITDYFPSLLWHPTAGTLPQFLIDLFTMNLVLNTPR